MAEIKFGVSQISNPTPANVNLWVRVFTVAAGVWMGWMATTDIIGPKTEDLINSILGLLIGLVNGIAPLFGFNVQGNTLVRASEVTAMDSDPKLPYSSPGDQERNK